VSSKAFASVSIVKADIGTQRGIRQIGLVPVIRFVARQQDKKTRPQGPGLVLDPMSANYCQVV